MWNYDNKRKMEKQKEIINEIQSVVTNFESENDMIIEKIIDSITVTAPAFKEEDTVMTYTILSTSINNHYGGANYRLGNIQFNLKKLFDSISNSALAIGGAVGLPILIPFAVVHVINNLFNPLKVNLTIIEGEIVYTMHLYQKQNKIQLDEITLFNQVNIQLKQREQNTISEYDFKLSLDKLQKLRIVKVENNIYKLRDTVSFMYK
ncbi:hypothetical protein [Fictibacillus norfolkensis]|uniref:Uncharacterized protein n=1 Tax=Fictibacillus norfolkensis TaxID=2762233 RepID=A0ABR8SR33_9BACL|nr:hypothetical protein [Fictibacillus norfolkensis]MBD7965957.1 hypothetical protein [Fictibacillus norfolkensis]